MTTYRHIARLALPLAIAGALLAAVLLLGVLRPAPGSATESTAKLPDLVADPPDGIGFATDEFEGKSHLLLRFNGYIHNRGPGALDFRGARVAPKLSPETEKRVQEAEAKKEGLPTNIENELAASPMHATQRLFTTEVGQEEEQMERAHVEEASSAQLIFSSADGHHHWHLQHAARYSLWNAAKTAVMAPAQKVGFCLDDSQRVETNKGPSKAVYADATGRDFCQQYKPNATSLFEGISPGWRDLYERELAFQWVDASNVQPGEYWLRSEVNPENVIKETGGANVPSYAGSATTVPGFDATAQAVATGAGTPAPITLTSKAFADANAPTYFIVAKPQHGTLGTLSGNHVTYTPAANYSGPDSFTFYARDSKSQFPTSPATATVAVAVGVGQGEPSVTIEGAPATIKTGASVQLQAKVSNDSPTVTWQVGTGTGTVTPEGLYTAPAQGGSATITATTSKGAKAEVTIEVLPRLLVGDPSASYTISDSTTVGREEAFKFTAASSGTVEELEFRTDGEENTGVTGVVLGMFAEGAGIPGKALAHATVSGTPPTESWIRATGLSVPVVKGTNYWLVVLPLGTAGALHFNAQDGPLLGKGDLESVAGKLGSLTEESSWVTFNQGPVGFQALESVPSVSIEGAPATIVAGESAQLKAKVANDGATVKWSASEGTINPEGTEGVYTAPAKRPASGSATITATTTRGAKATALIQITEPVIVPAVAIEGAPAAMTAGTSVQLGALAQPEGNTVEWTTTAGAITPSGLYTAPATPPAGGTVTVVAHGSAGGRDQRTITINPVPVPQPAPEAPVIPSSGVAGEQTKATAPSVTRPSVARIGHELIMTTLPSVAGRVRLTAYLGHRRLGTCSTVTPAGRSFTCRVRLARSVSTRAHIRVLASLRVGATIVTSVRSAAPITQMHMVGGPAGALQAIAAARFWCSPLAGNVSSGY